jgi:hypothetical protein
MPYALLADLTLVLHAFFIVFVVVGGALVFWRPGCAWLHIPCALWGVVTELRGWICPLTYLENDLRIAAEGSGYSGGFIDHYLVPLVYPPGLTPGTQVVLGMAVLLINVVIYALAWGRMRTKRNRRSPYS